MVLISPPFRGFTGIDAGVIYIANTKDIILKAQNQNYLSFI